MRKALIPIGIGLIVLVGVGGLSLRAMSQQKRDNGLNSANSARVERGDLVVTVMDTGTVDAAKVVEVKSRVSGRLAKLLVGEGDPVVQGQLIATIDPQETQLQVQQNEALLRGAQSAVAKSSIEIQQRRAQIQASYDQAVVHLKQIEIEMNAQPALTQAAIRSAETQLATAKAEKRRLLDSAQPTQRSSSSATVDEAQANLENVQSDYQRQADLEKRGYVSGKTVESAKLSLDLAKVRLANAKESLAKLRAQEQAEIAKADESIRQSQAELTRVKVNAIQDQVKVQDYESAKTDVEKAKADLYDPSIMEKSREQSQATVQQYSSVLSDSERQLRETQVRAPITGVVTKKELEVGELASGLSGFSSGTPIIRIEDRRGMRVKLNINEIDVAKLSVGMPARIDVDALPETPMTGKITKISPASSNSSSSSGSSSSSDAVVRYEVEVLLLNPTPRLRSGMSAKCSVDVLKRDKVVVLPVEFVGKEGDKYFVNVVASAKGKPLKTDRREVKVGAATGARYEILSGVSVGDVVTKPKFNGPERKGFMQAGSDDQ